MSTIVEMASFMGKKKRVWLIPLVTTLVFLGVVLVIAEGSALAPFLYTFF
jgi:hypothetical protein